MRWRSQFAPAPDRFSILGDSAPLTGRVCIEGSKNIALPLLAACCLLPGETALSGLPEILDVDVQIALLRLLGNHVVVDEKTARVLPARSETSNLPGEITLRSRGAIYAVCVPLCQVGRVQFKGIGGDSLPGRSLEPHMRAFSGFGFAIGMSGDWITVSGGKPRRAEFSLGDRDAGITASGLAIMLAAMAEGRSVLTGVSREPEVVELARFLSACGASIWWDGDTATIVGPASGKPVQWQVPPDRVVWGTFAAAAAATDGTVEMPRLPKEWLNTIVPVFEEAGIGVSTRNGAIFVSGRPTRPIMIETGPFPRFPSDLGPPLVALMAMAPGTSRLVERVYPDRFDHVRQLISSGLVASIDGNILNVTGGRRLRSGVWHGSGIRESAALLLSGLIATGKSTVIRAAAISRGYEDLPFRLNALGARISAEETTER